MPLLAAEWPTSCKQPHWHTIWCFVFLLFPLLRFDGVGLCAKCSGAFATQTKARKPITLHTNSQHHCGMVWPLAQRRLFVVCVSATAVRCLVGWLVGSFCRLWGNPWKSRSIFQLEWMLLSIKREMKLSSHYLLRRK